MYLSYSIRCSCRLYVLLVFPVLSRRNDTLLLTRLLQLLRLKLLPLLLLPLSYCVRQGMNFILGAITEPMAIPYTEIEGGSQWGSQFRHRWLISCTVTRARCRRLVKTRPSLQSQSEATEHSSNREYISICSISALSPTAAIFAPARDVARSIAPAQRTVDAAVLWARLLQYGYIRKLNGDYIDIILIIIIFIVISFVGDITEKSRSVSW